MSPPGLLSTPRGVFPTGHRNIAWQTEQIVGWVTAEETADRLRYLIARGQRGNRAAV